MHMHRRADLLGLTQQLRRRICLFFCGALCLTGAAAALGGQAMHELQTAFVMICGGVVQKAQEPQLSLFLCK